MVVERASNRGRLICPVRDPHLTGESVVVTTTIRLRFDACSTAIRHYGHAHCECVCVCVCVWRCSHSVWSSIQPTYVLLISFIRCQLTVTVTLMTVVVTKVSRLSASAHG